jgi:DNA-binding CsgD family transcriptional regulator
LRSGDWTAARRAGEESRRLAEQLALVPATELGLLAYLDAAEGRVDEARRLAELGLERSGDDRPGLLWNLGALGFLELSLGRAEQALGYLGRAGGLLDSMGVGEPGAFPFVADEAETLLDLGELPQARRRIEWLEARAEALGRPGLAAAALRCRGSSLAATGDLTGALDALERAVTLVERASLPLEQGRTLLALGATRRRDRRQRPAREALEEALAIFERLGAVLWAGKARDELGRIGGRKAAVGELTEAQRRVAQLAAGGLTNREIAQALFMSVRTVEGHLSHVYAKLGFRSRTELAAYFEPRD